MKRFAQIMIIIASVFVLALTLSACGTFTIDIENSQQPENEPVEQHEPAGAQETPAVVTLEPAPTETVTPTLAEKEEPPPESSVPDLVWLPFAGYHYDGYVLEVSGGQAVWEKLPSIPLEMYWDYSPHSGRLAYSAQFYHAAANSLSAVSDLWVYDYATGKNEQWLADNVNRAFWAPPVEGLPERLTAAVFDPQGNRWQIVYVDGPNQTELIADCASPMYSWSPDGARLVNVVAQGYEPAIPPECVGTYLYERATGASKLVSDLGTKPFMSGWQGDRPLWDSERETIIYPDQPFWVASLDGEPAYVPQIAGGTDPLEIPRPTEAVYSSSSHTLYAITEGMDGAGFWAYELSPDLRTLVNAYLIELRDINAYHIIGWWEPDVSILMLDARGTNPQNPLGSLVLYSLEGRTFSPLD